MLVWTYSDEDGRREGGRADMGTPNAKLYNGLQRVRASPKENHQEAHTACQGLKYTIMCVFR